MQPQKASPSLLEIPLNFLIRKGIKNEIMILEEIKKESNRQDYISHSHAITPMVWSNEPGAMLGYSRTRSHSVLEATLTWGWGVKCVPKASE